MFPIDLFLTDYGQSLPSRKVFEFAQRHQKELLEVLRVDRYHKGGSDEQILGDHIFYLIFSDSKSLCRLLVLGSGATSGYSGSGPGDFKDLMDWISVNKIDISYYSAHSYDEHLKLWGSELDTYGMNVPSQSGKHREYGPSPWDYGDEFVQRAAGISLEEYNGLSRSFSDTKQQLYSNTFEFLLTLLSSGSLLRSL